MSIEEEAYELAGERFTEVPKNYPKGRVPPRLAFVQGYIAGVNRAQEATREQVAEAMLDTPAVDFPGVHFASSIPDDVKDAEGLADALLARFDIREKEQA